MPDSGKAYLGDVPLFGEKPIFIGDDGTKYYEEDCHIIQIFEEDPYDGITLPAIGTDEIPFVLVNGEKVDPVRENPGDAQKDCWSLNTDDVEPGDIIHFVCPWDQSMSVALLHVDAVLQIGLNPRTGKRNQVANGENLFHSYSPYGSLKDDTQETLDLRQEVLKVIENVDVSEITSAKYLLGYFCTGFGSIWDSRPGLNLSGWDVSKVTDMTEAFSYINFAQEKGITGLDGWDVSNVTNMNSFFCNNNGTIGSDLSQWDVSNVTDMYNAVSKSSGWVYKWDSDLSGWDTSKVTNMDRMLEGSSGFTADLSEWCVPLIDSRPSSFGVSGDREPVWGTCPRGEFLPEDYSIEDCHIFIANGNEVKLPIPSGSLPIFVAVNGVDVTPTTLTTRTVEREEIGEDGESVTIKEEVQVASISAEDGDTIHAIFDWDNKNYVKQDWFKDILQFGLNSTGERNQLKNGNTAFKSMEANPTAIANLDVSNLTGMSAMFSEAVSFDQPIGGWNTSKVTDMSYMFDSSPFNQPIGDWDTSNVTTMDGMFSFSSFGQDISQWCVSEIKSLPTNFDYDSGFEGQTAKQPDWGKCPRLENVLPKEYSIEDCHIFVANDKPVNLPCQYDSAVIFVAVDGVEKDYATEVKGNIFEDSSIHAIFDWDNSGYADQDWFSDILQFGLNSETGERNQLRNGDSAFMYMTAQPTTISNLDVSNLWNIKYMFYNSYFNQPIGNWDVSNVTNMNGMFNKAYFKQPIGDWDVSNVTDMGSMFKGPNPFNQDIGKWNVSNVTNMYDMFQNAYSFNQDLSQWCVSKIDEKPDKFDELASAWESSKKPKWGTCPRGEDVPNIDDILPGKYITKDCHIFVANDKPVNLPIQEYSGPVFLAVDGVEKNYETEVKGKSFGYSTIHAIFDWDNDDSQIQDWFSDILQFGSRSIGEEPEGYVNPPALASGRIPNQLKTAYYAFYYMEANPTAISNLDVSNVRAMYGVFESSSFNQDISKWNVSNVTYMNRMFNSSSFNQDISQWNTSNVTEMVSMFEASPFNQDLSQWCVCDVDYKSNFDTGSGFEGDTSKQPDWGSCPRKENIPNIDDILPDDYITEDCHVFKASTSKIFRFPIPDGSSPIFVAVDGVEKDYETEVKDNIFKDSTIYAIFDWDNQDVIMSQQWISNIYQFGSRSPGGEPAGYTNPDTLPSGRIPNQLKDGFHAFRGFKSSSSRFFSKFKEISNLDVSNLTIMDTMFGNSWYFNQDISKWDVSNVTNMNYMFSDVSSFRQDIGEWDTSNVTKMSGMFREASNFNQDISKWDTSKVTNMRDMFREASNFDQDLSQWCVINVIYHDGFDDRAAFAGQYDKQPVWGTCPRGEDGS